MRKIFTILALVASLVTYGQSISLISFSGTTNGVTDYLKWEVAGKENVHRYWLQSSRDAVEFDQLLFIDDPYATGIQMPSGHRFYRFTVLDKHGHAIISRVISIQNDKAVCFSFISGGVYYRTTPDFDLTTPVTADVYTINGSKVKQSEIWNTGTLTIDQSAGTYIVIIRQGPRTNTFKVIKN